MLNVKDVTCTLESLVNTGLFSISSSTTADDWSRIKGLTINAYTYKDLCSIASYIGVTDEFSKVINTFSVPSGVIPAGFRPSFVLEGNCLCVNLVRDISYAEGGIKRPTKVLFSADSANPYEVAPLRNFIANLTCNPAIIYNSFINDPRANIGKKFKNRYEVMKELCRILGPGVDISIEVDHPFADESQIIEEIESFKEILTPYRLVVKIPHTGPINANNAHKLLDGTFDKGYEEGTVEDNMYGHNLAYRLAKRGYRINFTLMFEPHQTALALQARPYFINTFIKQRCNATIDLKRMLAAYDGGDQSAVDDIRNLMRPLDMLSIREMAGADEEVIEKARRIVNYRHAYDHEGGDGLDSTRHSLRVLRNSYLDNTRLIICSMSAEQTYMDIDKLLAEPEFSDMAQRVVITAPPTYLSRFASASGILSYQRLFLGAAQGQK